MITPAFGARANFRCAYVPPRRCAPRPRALRLEGGRFALSSVDVRGLSL